MPYVITQCYLPPNRGENPDFTPNRSRYSNLENVCKTGHSIDITDSKRLQLASGGSALDPPSYVRARPLAVCTRRFILDRLSNGNVQDLKRWNEGCLNRSSSSLNKLSTVSVDAISRLGYINIWLYRIEHLVVAYVSNRVYYLLVLCTAM